MAERKLSALLAGLAAAAAAAVLTSGCGAGDSAEPEATTLPPEARTSSVTTVPLSSAPTPADRFLDSVHELLLRQGLTEERATCVTDRLRSSFSAADLAAIERRESPKGLARKSAAAGTACGTQALAGG